MKKQLLRRFSAVCTGAVMSLTSLMATGAAAPMSVNAAGGSDDYARLLQYSMYLYDANMCGTGVESASGMSWRGNCHTTDEVPGGFHDAGDHAMFGLPQGFTASVLGWSYYEFQDAYNATGQAEHLKVILDYFCDFFKKSTKLNGNSVSSFLYQKGDGKEDHGYWGAPEKQPAGRKMFWTSNSASDMAANYAAALALNYINFGNAEDLKYAEALYKFSTQYNAIEKNGPTGFYLTENPSCQDEQANAAGWLYLATKNESYKNDCASKQTQYLGWCDNWDNRGLGAACVYAHITNDWSKVNNYLGSLCAGSNYLCMDNWGSARLNCSVQFTALVATKNSNANYGSWCQGQMDYILGNNDFNTCLVTGFASNSAKNTHHRAASGYQGYNPPDGMNDSTTTYHPTNGHVLIGALAGGPNKAGQYSDVMNDYQCNEVAIDYNSGLVGAAAGLYALYKTGSTVSTIEGVKKIYSGTVTPPPAETTGNQPAVTTTTPPSTTPNPGPSTGGNGEYTVKLGDSYNYNTMDEKMIGWLWADFGIPATEKVKKVEVNISTTNGNIGKWQGAFGTSTKVDPDYWTQSDDMQQNINGNSGTITWNVDSKTADIIQYNYGGELKLGVWWIDCQQFKVDSVKVYTDGTSTSSSGTTPNTTTAPPQSSSSPTTVTTAAPTPPTPSGSGAYTVKVGDSYNYSDIDGMIGWLWADFGIPATEKVKKVEVKISTANGNIGKWQGAFGTSTKVDPDYWTQSDDMQQNINGNSGVITWNVDSATADIIQYNYGGELKFGVWWIDSQQFTIDSVTVYTDGTAAVQTTAPVVTTTVPQTTTTAAPTPSVTKWGDADLSGSVDVSDAVLIARVAAEDKQAKLTEQGRANADVSHNGSIDADDALKILRYVARYLTEADLAK